MFDVSALLGACGPFVDFIKHRLEVIQRHDGIGYVFQLLFLPDV